MLTLIDFSSKRRSNFFKDRVVYSFDFYIFIASLIPIVIVWNHYLYYSLSLILFLILFFINRLFLSTCFITKITIDNNTWNIKYSKFNKKHTLRILSSNINIKYYYHGLKGNLSGVRLIFKDKKRGKKIVQCLYGPWTLEKGKEVYEHFQKEKAKRYVKY